MIISASKIHTLLSDQVGTTTNKVILTAVPHDSYLYVFNTAKTGSNDFKLKMGIKIQNKKYIIAAEAGMTRMWDSNGSLNKTRGEIRQAVININWKTDYRSFE